MQDNEKKPALRFKGFTDPWEQRKLGDLCVEFRSGEFISASDITETGEYPVFGGNGLRGFTDRFNHDGEYTLIGRQGALCGNVNFAVGKSYFTEHAIAVRADKKNQTRFLYYLFSTMDLGQYSGQSAQPGLAVGNLVELKSTLPDKQEQEKISGVLTALDTLITLHQRKYEKLVNIKKSMLDKMFPQNGASMPEIRFKGFTDPWEQRKLAEIANFSKGVGYSKNDLCEEGTPIILYGRLYTKYETSIFDVDTFVKENAGSVYSKGGEVIVPASGETAEDISIASVVVKPGILLGGDLNIVSPTTEYDSAFLALTISSGAAHKYLSSLAQGKSVVHLHNADIQSVSAKFPTKREQEKIHLLFGKIDTLITLHQRKLEKLQNIKKACLEKMFV